MKVYNVVLAAICAAIVLVMTSCGGGGGGGGGSSTLTSGTPSNVGNITGQIVDATSLAALVGYTITVQSTSINAVTDSSGNFTLQNVSDGSHTLIITNTSGATVGTLAISLTTPTLSEGQIKIGSGGGGSPPPPPGSSPTPGATPSPSPSPTPGISPTPGASPSPSPSPSPSASPAPSASPSPSPSPSATPTSGVPGLPPI